MNQLYSILICISIFFLSILYVYGQERTVSGRILAEDQPNGVPGVSILVAGTDTGTSTDIDGNFSLSIPVTVENPVLIISSVGYEKQRIKLSGKTNINVTLNSQVEELDEVIVTAFAGSAQARRSVTGSIGTLSSKEIENQEVLNIGQALEGKIAGVRVITSTGQPGAVPEIYIRGISSLTSSNAPLIVVDGASFLTSTANLESIDIESVSVLKDGPASVLYGGRAANGVILYTTKKSYRGTKPRVNVYFSAGLPSQGVPDYEIPNAAEYMRTLWRASRNLFLTELLESEYPNYHIDIVGQTPAINLRDFYNNEPADLVNRTLEQAGELANVGGRVGGALSRSFLESFNYNPYGTVDADGNPISPFDPEGNLTAEARVNGLKWDTDWEEVALNRDIFNRRTGLSVEGGSPTFRYYTAAHFTKQEGQVITSDFTRTSSRVNLETDPKSWITLGALNSFSYSLSNDPPQSSGTSLNPLTWKIYVPNAYPLYRRDAKGDLILDENNNPIPDDGGVRGGFNTGRAIFGQSHPVSSTLHDEYRAHTYLLTSIPYIEIRPVKKLSLRTQFGINNQTTDSKVFQNPLSPGGEVVNGRIVNAKNILTEYTWTNSINYILKLNELSSIDVIAGGELYRRAENSLLAEKFGALGSELDLAGQPISSVGNRGEERIARAFVSLKYTLLNRYFIELGGSRDGFSRFNRENRTSNFYSIGGAWVLSDEPFFPKGSFVNTLRLVGSYGRTGNAFIAGLFPSVPRAIGGIDLSQELGVYQARLFNEDTNRESTNVFNTGINFACLQGKITLSVEYFRQNTKDIITPDLRTPSSGYSTVDLNAGEIRNTGIDVQLNTVNIRKKDFEWTTALSLGHSKNTIISLPVDRIPLSPHTAWEVGKTRFNYFLPEFAGIDPRTGRSQFYRYQQDSEAVSPDNEHGIRYDLPRIKTFRYDSASLLFNRIDVGTSIPTINGGLNMNIRYKNLSLSTGFSFEFGGKTFDNNYSLLTNFAPGRQFTSNYFDEGWQITSPEGTLPLLHDFLSEMPISTYNLYDNSFVRWRTLSISYNLPLTLLKKAKYIRNMSVYIQGNNLAAFFVGKNRPPRGYDPYAGGVQGASNLSGSTTQRVIATGINIGL